MLRVRTGPESPEGNWGEITRDSNLNCGIAREREKINHPNTLQAHSQNKGRTERSQRRASQLRPGPSPLEAGGRGEGKRANSAPEAAFPTKLQTGIQFLAKDFLKFWMVDIHREGRGYTKGART